MAASKTTVDPGDSLVAARVQDWAEDKYRHVVNYAQMFSTGMKNKWNRRIYLELYSGCGRAQIEGTGRFIDTSALRVAGLAAGFDRLIFAELEKILLDALRTRIEGLSTKPAASFVEGDINKTWPNLVALVQEAGQGGRFLTFCFIDPFNCSDFSFQTIRGLSALYVDFLILIPSFMDANRAQNTYLEKENRTLDEFFGSTAWRADWPRRASGSVTFGRFVADYFGEQMKGLYYLYEGPQDMKRVDATDNSRPLYHLAYFSRSKTGLHFWRESRKYASLQRPLF